MNKIQLAKLLHKWTIEALDRFDKVEELMTPRKWEELDSLNRTVLVIVAKKILREFKRIH
jgi:hypothetical protein